MYNKRVRWKQDYFFLSAYNTKVIKEVWDEDRFLLITLIHCSSQIDLNHLYTDLTRTLICNYSYGDNSDYIVQGRVGTDSHGYKSRLVWMAASLKDCLSLLIWWKWTVNATETSIKKKSLDFLSHDQVAALFFFLSPDVSKKSSDVPFLLHVSALHFSILVTKLLSLLKKDLT